MDYEYSALLDRARQGLDSLGEDSRFAMPVPEVLYEGKRTLIRNFEEMLGQLRREQSHFANYLMRELGTAGSVDGKRLLLQGKLPTRKLEAVVREYTKTYVLCGECGKPDTHLERDGRTQVLRCEACGAFRPLRVVKALSPAMTLNEVKEGETYDVRIVDIGRRGDGIAKRGSYVLFVPGAAKGVSVKVKVVNLRGNNAFCKRV